MSSMENVKEWLNTSHLRYTEGTQSLNWPKIVKTVTDDSTEFFETGWNFLGGNSDQKAEHSASNDSICRLCS